eukprot:TRINITY_DN861_c0_g1_i2.p1 TRINITY_DN861_c0_g1~~TRINITY_DN861_c0_g1_i2.p1  ORF type:complete len:865 (-),score=258.73 TRINITY_DN861_c0_g1_i2:739-3333(-)
MSNAVIGSDSAMDTSEPAVIDEGLYSRQLYVVGKEAMAKMMSCNVLLVGLGGLGVEVAKNIVLAGVKSVVLFDNKKVTTFDLSANFYLSEKDIGENRAKACFGQIATLNNYVQVSCGEGSLSEDYLSNFQVVVLTDTSMDEQLRINDFCRSNNTRFIAADIRGVFSSLFVDFGQKFVVLDTDGEQVSEHLVQGISQAEPGIVHVVEDGRLKFSDGDLVSFHGVSGMTELNDADNARKIKITGKHTFTIEDTTGYSKYESGGYVHQVKQPKEFDFLSLRDAIAKPEYIESDFGKFGRPLQLHLGFLALHEFQSKHDGQLPGPHNAENAAEVVASATRLNEQYKLVDEIDGKLITTLAFTAKGNLNPMAAAIGGIVAQEVLKGCTNKFTPLKQWLYFDAVEVLPEPEEGAEALPASLFEPEGNRYDGQVVCIGKDVHRKLTQLNYFLVGAGAIGCEMMKNWAMLGLGSDGGQITVTDMDVIEKSNLNRQFLFRPADVESPKSTCAAKAALAMNPSLNIRALTDRVGSDTENVFTDKFFASLDGVCNALDNIEARLYMDSQCVFHGLSLLESGTLGTKGNTQVVVPCMTESYASSRDPPETSIPVCTLHHFPNRIEHTLQWARDMFEGVFFNMPDHINAYLSNSNFLKELEKQVGISKLETIKGIRDGLVKDRPVTFSQCVHWARIQFEELFHNKIVQMLFSFPKDLLTTGGTPFWSGPKRAPDAVTFDASNELHFGFIVAASNLRAAVYGLKGVSADEAEVYHAALQSVIVPDFTPSRGIKIPTSESEAKESQSSNRGDDRDEISVIQSELPKPGDLAGFRLQSLDFEKDDDSNYHMDFITACSNLRATNYAIPMADKHKSKARFV